MTFWILVCPWLPADGMALFPFILVKTREQINNPVLVHHEKIHLRQQLELLVVPFYILYLANYLINLFRWRNHHLAYLKNVFEREAYLFERDFGYLKRRRFCAWISLIGSNSARL